MTAIMLISSEIGFCRLLTGAILAHELMHAWLRLTGVVLAEAHAHVFAEHPYLPTT